MKGDQTAISDELNSGLVLAHFIDNQDWAFRFARPLFHKLRRISTHSLLPAPFNLSKWEEKAQLRLILWGQLLSVSLWIFELVAVTIVILKMLAIDDLHRTNNHSYPKFAWPHPKLLPVALRPRSK